MHNIIVPIRDGAETFGILGINVDITEQKQAEEALRESESRYRALAESTRDIIYILDQQGTLLYANRAASQCIGIPLGDIVGKRQADLFPPEMARNHMERIERVLATGDVSEQDEKFHFGPAEVWLRVHLLPLRDEAGQMTSVMGVCHNITDRKRAEEALQKAHEELERRVEERTAELSQVNEELAVFRRFAEASGQGFGMADLEGRVIYTNPALCRMIGETTPENALGNHYSIYYSEESKRKAEQEILPAVEQRGYWEGELQILSRQGKLVPTWYSSFIIRDERGIPLRHAAVITDITERKCGEEALAESEEKYRHLVETTDTGYLILDEDGRVVDANEEYVRLTGHHSLNEIMGAEWENGRHPMTLNAMLGKSRSAWTREPCDSWKSIISVQMARSLPLTSMPALSRQGTENESSRCVGTSPRASGPKMCCVKVRNAIAR